MPNRDPKALVPIALRVFRGEVCPACGRGVEGDVLARARETVEAVMDGRAGRHAIARLRAAELVLGKQLLSSLSDDDLLAEVERRARDRGRK